MTTYRFLATDLLTGVVREELPLDKVTVGHVRNGAAGFSGSISQRHSKATRANLDPGRTLMLVERDGQIVGDGILWGGRPSSRGQLQLSGASLWSAFHRRWIDHSRAYSQVDQLDIARDLVKWAQGSGSTSFGDGNGTTAGDLNVTVDTTTSGVLRDRTWPAYELKNLGQAVEQLAGVDGGFDFDVDLGWNGDRDEIVRTFTTWYPRRGRRTALVLEAGVNIEDWGYGVDAGSQAFRVHGLGKGQGDDMVRTTQVDASLLGVYPLLEDVVSHKDVSRLDTLVGHAKARLTARRLPVTVPTILNVRLGPQLPFGAWVTGDEVTLRIDDGWAQLDSIFRVDEWSLTVERDGRERVDLTLVETGTVT